MFPLILGHSCNLFLHLIALSSIEKVFEMVENGRILEAILYIVIPSFAIFVFACVIAFVQKRLFPKD
jgi:hypothetical protein